MTPLEALRYISSPTMGLPTGREAEEFVQSEDVNPAAARYALEIWTLASEPESEISENRFRLADVVLEMDYVREALTPYDGSQDLNPYRL